MNIFSYDSKPSQIMMRIGDLMILNVIYLVCCLPIFTIGAAQAGLFNAVKVLMDKEDDSSPTVAFFKGFANGFLTVTLAWGLMTVLVVFVFWMGMTAYALGAPLWIIIPAIAICAIFQTLVPAFHSRFGCTAFQLIRNVWFLLIAHPLRAIGTVLLIWLPVLTFLLMDVFFFMTLTPIWGTLFFSTAFSFGYSFLKKPFQTLIDHFNETHATPSDDEEVPAITDGSEESDDEFEDEYDEYDEECENEEEELEEEDSVTA